MFTGLHSYVLQGMEDALLHRMDPRFPLSVNGRRYRSLSLVEMGREYLEGAGVRTGSMDRYRISTEMMHFRSGAMMGTSDFAGLMANVARKRLATAYASAPSTYQVWARQGPDALDFRQMKVVSLSAAPDLLQLAEHGEFKYGTLADGGETYSVVTYGRLAGLSRQAILNDDLGAFAGLVAGFGASARRLENRLVYAQLTANATLSDGGALFNATALSTAGGHANLQSGGGSALQASSLAAARAAMRLQKGQQSEELSIAPRYLIVPASLEATAYQLTSSAFTPATAGAINEFRQGGRVALEPVVEAVLDSNSVAAWYLAADHRDVDTVEYCYLSGAVGPFIDSQIGFEVDGIEYKCRLDFAAKAIDFRGLQKAAGL